MPYNIMPSPMRQMVKTKEYIRNKIEERTSNEVKYQDFTISVKQNGYGETYYEVGTTAFFNFCALAEHLIIK